ILLSLLLFAAMRPVGLPRHAATVAFTVFAALFAIRMGVVGYAWYEQRGDLTYLRAVMASVGPGARVLTAEVSPEDAPRYWHNAPRNRTVSFGFRVDSHMAALLLIERRAYWPFLFDNPSQQPIETLPPYRELAGHADTINSHLALAVPGKADLCGYDYVLL